MVKNKQTLSEEVLILSEFFDEEFLSFIAGNFVSLMRPLFDIVVPRVVKGLKREHDIDTALQSVGHNVIEHLNPSHYKDLFQRDMELYGVEKGIYIASWHIMKHEIIPNTLIAMQITDALTDIGLPPEFMIMMPVIRWFLKQYHISDLAVF